MIRKYYPHNTVLFIGSRVQEGIPLPPAHHINLIVWGILARASLLNRIRVCAFVVMGNHIHFIVVVDDPRAVSYWLGYVKTEISHAINKMLGRRQRSVWVAGSDTATILDPETVIEKIAYTYANPATANLEDSIDLYPGVSSWEMFLNEQHSKTCKKVSRPRIAEINSPCLSITEQKRLVAELDTEIQDEIQFELEPFAWVDSFARLSKEDIPDLKEKIISRVRQLEQEARDKRKEKGKYVIGATTLRRQSMLKEHQPKKFGKKMICLSSCVELRARFIAHYKAICRQAREVYESWKLGDFRPQIPPGLMPPKPPLRVSGLPVPL